MNLTKISLIIAILSFVLAGIFYPVFPDKIVSHWNYAGQPDGYAEKFWGLFLMPLLSLVMICLFAGLPRIDPFKQNYKSFSKYYEGFILVLTIFLSYVFLLTIFANLGFSFNMGVLLLPAFAFMFYYLGMLLENAKRNWFVGIRTPWTLSSERVWHKTHHLGGKLFKISSIIVLIGLFFPRQAFLFVIIPIIASAMFVVVYSYFIFRKSK